MIVQNEQQQYKIKSDQIIKPTYFQNDNNK
jgi:hypothetical protein